MQPVPYFSITSQLLIEEAEALWMQVEILVREKNLFMLSHNGRSILFKSVDFGENSMLGMKVADDKELAHAILSKLGYPIARTLYLDREGYDMEHLSALALPPFPLIIKPLGEAHGQWLKMDIGSVEELDAKLRESFSIYDRMIVQQQIVGKEFRVLVCKWSILLAYYRHPPTVTGDGISTILALIDRENAANPLRWEGYHSPLSLIRKDDELIHHIGQKGRSLETVPVTGETVELRWNSNVGTGGTIEEITPILHPSIRDMCLYIAQYLKLGICGIDIIASDPARPLAETGGIVLEINASPGIGGDREMTSVNVAREILKRVFDLSC